MRKYREELLLPFKWCQFCMRCETVTTSTTGFGDESVSILKCKHQTTCEAAEFAKEREKALRAIQEAQSDGNC